MKKYSIFDYLRFILPSLLGVFFFIVPVPYGTSFTIPVAIFAKSLNNLLAGYLSVISTVLICFSSICSLFVYFMPRLIISRGSFLKNLFLLNFFWLSVRFLGACFALLTLLQWGPQAIWSSSTGAILLGDLLPVLVTVFTFAGLLLPLLLNYGLLEFFGSIFTIVMRPIFTLPGRSSIDCLASTLGDGTIGVLLTNKQYQSGYYTQREACVISTTFSFVSITFTVIILSYVNLEHLAVPYYFCLFLVGITTAILCPRLPPLSQKKDIFFDSVKKTEDEKPKEISHFSWGLSKALQRSQKKTGVKDFFKEGFQNILDMWFGVLPVVMTFGTVALIVAEKTPIFRWLGYLVLPILYLFDIPEAEAAAQTILIGFADMFLPVILSSGIESELTKFIIATLSVTQLIYMSEVGGLILGSKIPLTFFDLIKIFLLRTAISLPIVICVARIFI